MRNAIVCLLLVACGQFGYGPDGGSVGYSSDSLCVEGDTTCTTGGSGTNGGGGGDAGTAVQLCESSARESCCNLGYCGNAYCVLVFAQGCSPTDQQLAISFCYAHPDIRHDDQCHPQW
jgi:hypothetical protein